MENKFENIYHFILGFVIFAILAVISIYYFDIRKDELNEIDVNGKYTISKIIKIKTPNSYSTPLYFIRYKINNKYYNYTESYNGFHNRDIKYLFVKFSLQNPENCKIIFDIRVPSSTKEAPQKGWSPEEFKELFEGETE